MTTQLHRPRPVDQASLETLVGRAVSDISAAYGGSTVVVGHALGLYVAMWDQGPLPPAEVARRAGAPERYVREWLYAQAAGGYVDFDSATGCFELNPEQALVFADESSPVFIPSAWHVPATLFREQERFVEAYRNDEGIAWSEHDHRLHEGVATFYRNGYRASLVSEWLPALTGVVPLLEAGILVADIGCGYGHSTTLMAEAFPWSTFRGFDTHSGSVEAARGLARERDLDNVSFEVVGAGGIPGRDYGLVCFFDCLHDLGDPLAAARQAYGALAPDGAVLLVEPFASDRVEDNFNPVGRLYYAASSLVCLPHAVSEGGLYALGAQAGEAATRAVFEEAGFTRFRRAAETPFNLIFEVRK
ncbi:MAG: class I SAM-dependent methyltransferase [Dehalococcoidia bacterium]